MTRTVPFVALALLTASALGAVLPSVHLLHPRDDSADVRFLRDMSVHHAQAVDMSMRLVKRSSDPKVQLLAQDIALTQQAQIGQMTGWLTAWGVTVSGSTPPMKGMDRAAMGLASADVLTSLERLDGSVADERYLTLMRRHHLGGVAMAKSALNTLRSPLTRSMANRIIASQTAEVRTIDAMLGRRAAPDTPVAPMTDMSHE